MNRFYLYKGLKKPLVFYGLKNQYIYYALACCFIGLIIVAVLSNIIGIIGVLIGGGLIGTSVWLIYRIQDKVGLYKKRTNKNELHVFPVKIKLN